MEAQRTLIHCLGLPLTCSQLAEIAGVETENAIAVVDVLQKRCDQLDPDGQLSARIRAGAKPKAGMSCTFCCSTRVYVRQGKFTNARCRDCGRIVKLRRDIIERGGQPEAGPLCWV